MRRLFGIGLSLACPFASAAEPPSQAPQEMAVPQHAASVQLQNNEIAALLEHLQSQHVYLKHLENMRRALEKELSIVRLMSECDRFGSACTGRGIVERTAPETLPIPAPVPQEAIPWAPPVLSEPLLHELPVVAGVYREAATLIYQGRDVEVRAGAKVGPFTVTAVALDRIELDGPDGAVTLAARWHPPADDDKDYELLKAD